jgi:carboxyl-terminal processing protease
MAALMSGVLNRFVFLNYLRHEKEFKQYTSPKMFEEKYTVSDQVLNDLKNYAAGKDSIHLDINNKVEKSLLQRQIKVLTAREIWRTEGFYEVNNTYDSIVAKALELMR